MEIANSNHDVLPYSTVPQNPSKLRLFYPVILAIRLGELLCSFLVYLKFLWWLSNEELDLGAGEVQKLISGLDPSKIFIHGLMEF